jgi:hypothetical protein
MSEHDEAAPGPRMHRYRVSRRIILPVLIVWTLGTLALTMVPDRYVARAEAFSFDKVGHVVLFGGWTALLGLYRMYRRYGLRPDGDGARPFRLMPLLAMGIGFGVAVEVLQFILPLGRSFSAGDMAADAAGCVLAVVCLRWARPAIVGR